MSGADSGFFGQEVIDDYSKHDLDDALEDCDETIKHWSKDIQTVCARAKDDTDRGDYDAAIADYSRALELDSQVPVFYRLRGISYKLRGVINRVDGDIDKAIADYDEAIQLDPKYRVAYLDRGTAYNLEGNYDKALENFNQALQLEPNSAVAYVGRGLTFMLKGAFESAIGDFNKAIELDPKNALAYADRGCTYCYKRFFDLAIDDLGSAIALDPKNEKIYLDRALANFMNGKEDASIADLNQVIELDRRNSVAYNMLADIRASSSVESLRDGKEAVKDATFACRLTGWKSSLQVGTLAAAYAEAGDFDAAVKWEEWYLTFPDLNSKLITVGNEHLQRFKNRQPYHRLE